MKALLSPKALQLQVFWLIGRILSKMNWKTQSLYTGLSADGSLVIDKSRMNREVHVRFREGLWVKVPLATRLRGRRLITASYSMELTKKAAVAMI